MSNATQPTIKIDISNYRYPGTSVDTLAGISLALSQPSVVGVAGPNASGKSTFLRVLAGLAEVDAASKVTTTIDSREIQTLPRLASARLACYVPAAIKPVFNVSVEEFVLQGRYSHNPIGLPTDADRAAALVALKRLHCEFLANISILQLSAGQLQLALLARAIAQDPTVLLLDECLSFLDLGMQGILSFEIGQQRAAGKTVFLVSHDLNLLAQTCDQILWLECGRMLCFGTPAETFTQKTIDRLYQTQAPQKFLYVENNGTVPEIRWRLRQ